MGADRTVAPPAYHPRIDPVRDAAHAQRGLLAFAAAVLAFHHLPAVAGPAGDWVDLLTPVAVAGASAWVLVALRAGRLPLAVALLAGVLYVDGHGIHLAANSIANESPAGDAADAAHFWDEEWSHVEWHLGWLGLLAGFCLAESARPRVPARYPARHLAAVLLGFTLFTSTVEGGTWWLAPGAAVAFTAWQARAGRVILATVTSALLLASLLVGIWAAWHGGVPEFSELGWI